MASSNPGKRANPALYGGMPAGARPAGMAPRLLEFADELRTEGVAVGTSELLDAFNALDAVSWTSLEDFREALATTLAKSQEDRHVLDVLFDRFFFRAVEREAIEQGLREERFEGGEEIDWRRCASASARRSEPDRRRDARPGAARDRSVRAPGRGLRRDRGGRPAHRRTLGLKGEKRARSCPIRTPCRATASRSSSATCAASSSAR